jgi:hypothetical protein
MADVLLLCEKTAEANKRKIKKLQCLTYSVKKIFVRYQIPYNLKRWRLSVI